MNSTLQVTKKSLRQRAQVFINLSLVLILVISFLAYPMQTVEAAVSNYYVSTTGSDSNPGTSASKPLRKVQTAVNKVSAGGTIFIMGGTYNESIKFSRSGTSTAPIKMTRYNSAYVTINGGSNPAILITNSSIKYWIIQNLKLVSTNNETVSFATWGCNGSCNGVDHWTFYYNTISGPVKVYGAYNRFQGNHVYGTINNGNGGNGITDRYGASHHNIFKGNKIHDFSQRGIWSNNRTHDDIFDGNIIYNITKGDGRGINLDGYGSVEYRHTIKNNIIYNCSGAGIALENVYASVIENNTIHDIQKEGIGIIMYGPTVTSPNPTKCIAGGESNQFGDTNGDNNCEGDIANVVVRNNLIYNGGSGGGIYLRHAGGIKIYGNTIHNQSGYALKLDSGVKYTPQIEIVGNIFSKSGRAEVSLFDYQSLSKDSNNLFNPSSSSRVYASSTKGNISLTTYKTTYKKGSGSLVANPLFINSAGSDYHLQSSSPAIDKGISIGVAYDIERTARPVGAANDIGAYEHK